MRENDDPRVQRVLEVLQTLIGLSGLTQREIGRRLHNGREYLVRRVLQGDASLKIGQLFELADAIEIHPLEVMKMVFASSPEPSALVRKINTQVELLTALRAADMPHSVPDRGDRGDRGDHGEHNDREGAATERD
jgi:transcriptional regulator with XRE-family HTH domain